MRCCSAVAARLFDSISAARSVSASGVSPPALRGAHSSGPCGAIVVSPSRTLTGEYPFVERGGEQERLERGAGLPAAAPRAVELRLPEVAAADEREHVAVARIDRDERRLQLRIVEPPQSVRDGALGRLLQLRHERRPHVPVGRMVAAEPIAELLAQELLRVAAARIGRAGIRRGCGSARPCAAPSPAPR